ncbi:hypothetical protein HYFRA_00006187 [Hymenoscyphus fraxineus]|uniref:galacturonan 1,4-alpha-galacturonidase n=1 Tax=Hymenoscyphus fraxineus TaxID=746836 RepID=A0A9N9LCE0_9HELO|nr:hypothetical protein HYFRA_00006187 [Hymenoscyphus fraxineus]
MYHLSLPFFLLLTLLTQTHAQAILQNPLPPIKDPQGKTCIVHALGNQTDDAPQILKAFETCNHGGIVVFPQDEVYWIATRLNPVVEDVEVRWRGVWVLSDDLDYWRTNSYPVTFQNHATNFILSGTRIAINGYGTGGINGNGNAWYDAEEAVTRVGRPMPFNLWNVSEVRVENFYIKDSPLWALNVMNGTNMHFENITCNSTALRVPYGVNWVQNTDGFDTMDSHNISLLNFTYQGGDDCVAIKPRSHNIYIENVLCRGGNGIAIGSLGQYKEDSSVTNTTIRNVRIERYNEDMHNAAYIKTWIGEEVLQEGYESGGVPRGGGWGEVTNLLFENFLIHGSNAGPSITQSNGNNGSFAGTSKMQISNVTFRNFHGYTQGGRGNQTASVSCSKVHPCFGIAFEDVQLASAPNGSEIAPQGRCEYVATKGVVGLVGAGC